MLDKKLLSKKKTCARLITPAPERAGWAQTFQLLEDVSSTDRRMDVRGKLAARGKSKRADRILYNKVENKVAFGAVEDGCSAGLGMGYVFGAGYKTLAVC